VRPAQSYETDTVGNIDPHISTMKPDGEVETVNRHVTDYRGKTSEGTKNCLPRYIRRME